MLRTATKQCRYGKVTYLPNDVYIGRSLEIYGEWSEGEMAVFRTLLRPGDVAIDAGANIGALTLGMAQLVGASGAVHAFEPQPAIFDLLRNNIVINDLLNVRTYRQALGTEPGTIRIPPLDYGRASNFGGLTLGGAVGEEAQVVTIDSLELAKLRLLKIDVEGMEYEVLSGARDTIGRLAPAIYLENDRDDKSERLISLLFDLDYRLWWHVTPLFNPKNFFGNADNIFGRIKSLNMVALPRSKPWSVSLPEILSPKDSPLNPAGRIRKR